MNKKHSLIDYVAIDSASQVDLPEMSTVPFFMKILCFVRESYLWLKERSWKRIMLIREHSS